MSASWERFRLAIHFEHLKNFGILRLVTEKLEKLGKVRETVACLWCAIAIAIVTK